MPPEWNVHDKISTQPGLWMHFPSSQYIELMVCLMLHDTYILIPFTLLVAVAVLCMTKMYISV